MTELVNLRIVRKRMHRRAAEARADANRLVHGQPKHVRDLADAQRQKTDRDLAAHRLDKGDGR